MFPTTPPPSQRLLVFARLPELGRVKSRIAATLGDAKALEAYEAMLGDLQLSIGESTAGTEVEILWAPTPDANGASLQRAFGHRATAMQTGATLGDRLSMAFSERFFFHRTEKIIAIGVDDPSLSRELIDQAFGLLDSCEWVIGPATDGGYYLIGCRAAAFEVSVFDEIEWGTDTVLARTLEKIGAMQRTVALLPHRTDLDRSDDLQQYAAVAPPGALRDLLKEWGWSS